MSRDDLLKQIKNNLIKLEYSINFDNEAGLFDINKHCENIFCGLLNRVFGYNLVNANIEEKNYDYVDLKDDVAGIYVQVTSNKDNSKIKDTIKGFIKKKYYEKSKLQILIIGGKKKKYYTNFDTENKFVFDKNKDIIDTYYLFNKISTLEIDQIYNILDFLNKEVNESYYFNKSNIEKRFEENSIKFFSKRYVYTLNDENNKKSINDEEKNKNQKENIKILFNSNVDLNNNIILIGEAGTGKTELCKKINNDLNSNDNIEKICFYYSLINYTGQSIDCLKPNSYSRISNNCIVFILDGFDEIKSDYKDIFIKNLNSFIKNYNQARIILTSRLNFYKYGSYNESLNNFNVYKLVDFNDDNLKELCEHYSVNFSKFTKLLRDNDLNYIIYNPFYAEYIISYYSNHGNLLSKNEIINSIIEESFELDIKKYNTTIDLQETKNKIFSILKTLSLGMALLEKNSLTISEINSLIKKEDRDLLNYVGIWKNNDNNYSFIHNIFMEYLVSEKMQELDYDYIKKIITFEDNSFNPYWVNILSFLIVKKIDYNFIDWLIEVYPSFVFYLEKQIFSLEQRIVIFKTIFSYYEKRKIWFPNIFYYNNRFIDFINCGENVKYLISKLNKDNHYTVIFNSLNILEQFDKIDNIEIYKEELVNLAFSKNFNSSQKEILLKILSKNKLINDDDILKIYNLNKKNEDSYLRASYYYYLTNNIVTKKNIILLINGFYDYNNTSKSDDELYYYTENKEFEKVFLNIYDYDLIKFIIEKIQNINNLDEEKVLSEKIVENLCDSIINLKENNKIIDLLFNLFEVIENKNMFAREKIIIDYLDKTNLRFDFYKFIKKKDYSLNNYLIKIIMDDNCIEYFYKEYLNFNYSDEDAYKVLQSFYNNENVVYNQLNELYYSRTKINYIEEKNKINNEPLKIGNRVQDYFDSIFDREIFIKNINEFLLNEKLSVDIISKNDIKNLNKVHFINNEKKYCIIHFLKNFVDNDSFYINDNLKKIDWDYFILAESFNILVGHNDIEVSKLQIERIEEICKKNISKISFRNSIKYSKDGKSSTSKLCVFLCYMMYRFNFRYSDDVLLDMLSFKWASINNKENYFDYIVKLLPKDKVKERIIDNIKTIKMRWDVLKYHVYYCLANDVKNVFCYLEKYLLSKKFTSYEKVEIVDYTLKYCDKEYIKENILDKVDFDIKNSLIDGIIKIDKNYLEDYIKNKVLYSKNKTYKYEYLKKLVKIGNIWGLEKYYSLLKKEMKTLDNKNSFHNSFKSALCLVDDINCFDIILKIYILSFDKTFIDNKFDSIYSGCKESFIKMAFSNLDNNSDKFVIDKLQSTIDNSNIDNISITYYIIDEIKERKRLLTKKHYTTEEVVKYINELFPIKEKVYLNY